MNCAKITDVAKSIYIKTHICKLLVLICFLLTLNSQHSEFSGNYLIVQALQG